MELELLRSRLTGRVLLPGETGYDEAVTGFNLALRREPRAVVEAASAHDISAAVRFAAGAGLGVAVQATGHGGAPVAGDFIQINTSRLDECAVQLGENYGWARVGAGVRWERVLEAAAQHGLAPLAGSAPHVGVVGYLTGGGYGPIVRSHGLASDLIRAFEVVTGDGEFRRVTAAEEPELFWGLRGGKGALGIVTAVEFDLLPITELTGGSVYYDGADAERVLRRWRDWSDALPAQGTTSIALKRLPDLPMLPPQIAGRLTVCVRFAWVGDDAEGEQAFAPMRDAAPVVLGAIAAMPYAALGSIHQDPDQPMPVMDRNALFTGGLPDGALDTLLAWAGPESTSPKAIIEIRQLGGAIGLNEVPSAVGHRGASHSLFVSSIDTPGIGEVSRAHADEMLAALAPWTGTGILPNFQMLATPQLTARAYERNTLARLAGLVARFDPRGVLSDGRRLSEAAEL